MSKTHELNLTLHGLVEKSVLQHEDSTAVLYDNMVEKFSLTYIQLWQISNKVRDSLSGIGCVDEVIGLCPLLDHRMPAVLLGVMRIPASFYNFNVNVGFEFVLKVLKKVGSTTILIHKDNYQIIKRELLSSGCEVLPIVIPDLEDYFILRMNGIESKQQRRGMAYCITTSGTTGSPKVVLVPHECITPNITCLSDHFCLTSSDLVLGATALTFDPSIVEIFMTLSTGGCLLIVPHDVKMIPELLLQEIYQRNQVTVMQITPTLLFRFNTETLSQTILSDNSMLRVMALGGEPFPAGSTLTKMSSGGNKTCFYNLYGTTELSCWATCYKVSEEDLTSDRVIPLGDVLLDTFIEIRNVTEQSSLQDEGYLYIGGVSRYCLIDDEINTDKHNDNPSDIIWRNTGDLVKRDTDGQIYYMGRKDAQIKRNGQRVNMEEIKMICQQYEHIDACEAVMIDNSLVIFVCCLGGNVELTLAGILNYLKTHAPSYWLPDDVFILQNLPVTSHGKIDRKTLKKMYADIQARNKTQLNLVEYFEKRWTELLGLSTSSLPDRSFLQSGGNSLLAVHLANDVEIYTHTCLPELVDRLLRQTYSEIKQYLISKMTNPENVIKGSDLVCKNIDSARNHVDKNVDNNVVNNFGNYENKIKSYVHLNDNDFRNNDNVNYSDCKERKGDDNIKHQIIEVNPDFKPKLSKYSDDNYVEFNITEDSKHSVLLTDTTSNLNRKDEAHISGKSIQKRSKCNPVSSFSISRCNKIFYINHGSNECTKLSDRISDFTCGLGISRKNTSMEICLVEKWKYNTGKCVDASPLIVVNEHSDSCVFIGSHSHKFSAINVLTGTSVWETVLPDRIESSACVSACGKYLIVGCYDGCVYVMNIYDGTVWWHYDTGNDVKSSPTVDPVTGYVYIGSHSQSVYCLNITDSKLVWKNCLQSGSIFSSPAICSQTEHVYVATLEGVMFALDKHTGSIVWRFCFNKPVFSSLTVTASGLYVGCTDGCVYSLSKTGEMLWKVKTECPIFSSPSVVRCADNLNDSAPDKPKTCPISLTSQERIVIGSHDKCLYCVLNNAEVQWKVPMNSAIYSSPYQTVITPRCKHCSKSSMEKTLRCKDCTKSVTDHIHSIDSSSCVKNSFIDKDSNNRDHVVVDTSCQKDSGVHINNCADNSSMDRGDFCDKKHLDNTNYLANCASIDGHSCPNNLPMERDLSDRNHVDNTSCHTNCGIPLHIVVACSTTGTVYIVDVHSGKLLCEHQLDGEIFSSPVMYDNTIVVGCRDDNVYCFNVCVK